MEGAELALKYGSELITDPGVQRFIGSVVDQPVERFADEVRYHRFKRQVKMWTRAKELLEDAGLEAKPIGPVDLSVIVPLLESGSLEDDERLAEKWAALLAAAARGDDRVHPSYPDILRQLTPREAAILDTMHGDAGGRWATTPFEPYVASERAGFPVRDEDVEAIEDAAEYTQQAAGMDESLRLSVDNLLRLRLVRRVPSQGLRFSAPMEEETKVVLTSLGHGFVGACKPPTS